MDFTKLPLGLVLICGFLGLFSVGVFAEEFPQSPIPPAFHLLEQRCECENPY